MLRDTNLIASIDREELSGMLGSGGIQIVRDMASTFSSHFIGLLQAAISGSLIPTGNGGVVRKVVHSRGPIFPRCEG